MRKRTSILLALAVLAVAPLAAGAVIEPGIDLFTTPPGGSFYDFSRNPIPAGFFCEGSPAFDGRIELRGVPLVSEVPGQLRGADTVVERLDSAAFDGRGEAETRVRVRALSLVGTEPVRTPCGSFQVHVTLAGKQRVTLMRILRTEENGGTFRAPIEVEGRMTFVPLDRRGARPLVMTGGFSFPAVDVPWSFSAPEVKQVGPVVVDTDGDQIAETRLPGTSSFAPGWSPGGQEDHGACRLCEPEVCHEDPSKQHCTGPIYACSPANCP